MSTSLKGKAITFSKNYIRNFAMPFILVIFLALMSATEFTNAIDLVGDSVVNSRTSDRQSKLDQWVPPPPNAYKINVDGSWERDTREASIGIVIRNDQGQFMGGLAKPIGSTSSLLMAEAIAARDAVNFAKAIGYHGAWLETDARRIVDMVDGKELSYSEISPVIYDLRQMKSQGYIAGMLYTPRTANKVAHTLAEAGHSAREELVWMEDPPSWLEQGLRKDVME